MFELFGASPALAGVTVTPRAAMRCAPVNCAVRVISESLGQVPVRLYKKGADGSKTLATDHPAFEIVGAVANSFMPASRFRELLTRDAILHNGGFAHIGRNGEGKPVELIRFDPDLSPVTVDWTNIEPTYKIGNGANARPIQREDILHLPSPAYDPRGLIADGKEAIGLAIALEQHAARLFGRGARPSGLLKFKSGTQNAGVLQNVIAAWNLAHAGNKSGGTAVLPADVDWQAIVLSCVDAQFNEQRQYALGEIARLFRVPLHMIYELSRATWSNAEQMGREFVDLSLMTWAVRWCDELMLKLLSPEDRADYVIEFDFEAFLQADFAQRVDAYSKGIAMRAMNPNEVRSKLGLPSYAGGDKFENPNTTTAVLSA